MRYNNQDKRYFEHLDGLRFIAIFFVFIQHFAPHIGSKISAGYYGVDLFFVISGFLITGILIESKSGSFLKDYLGFLARRTLRIFPLYYLSVLILYLSGEPSVRNYITWLVSYTYNYAMVIFEIEKTPVNHFWSLCVEEQFYLIWPFVVLTIRSIPRLLLTIIVLIVFVGYAQITANIFDSLTPFNYSGLLTRMSSIGLGALGIVAYKLRILPNALFRGRIIEVCILIVLTAALLSSFRIRFLIFGLTSLYFVLKATYYSIENRWLNSLLSNKSLVYLGTISYGMYVFHFPVIYYFDHYFFNGIWSSINFEAMGYLHYLQYNPWLIKFPLYSIISIAISSLSFRYLESPILSLKKYFVS